MVTENGNEIVLKDKRFFVKARMEKNVHYAFYLHHKGVEKKHYIIDNEVGFTTEIVDGVYTISFYRRDKHKNVKREEEIILVRNGKIVKEKILANTDDYRISLYDNNSPVTFITFNGADATKKVPPFGLKYLFSKGYNVIGCFRNSNQYQDLSFLEFKEVVSDSIKNKEVFLYGSSLGGYCAVYYAGAVNGTVIAAAPKNSAHPRMIDNQRNSIYKKEDFVHCDILDNPITSKPVYIILDPYVKTDQFFLESFIKPAYPKCEILEVPYGGHEVLYHVNKLKKLGVIIASIVNNENPFNGDLALNIVDTEFTYYGKALASYRNMLSYIKKIETIDNRHPAINRKLSNFKNSIGLVD